MTVTSAHTITPLTSRDQQLLRAVVDDADEADTVTVTIDGHTQELDPQAAAAVIDLLLRLSSGQGVMVSSIDELVTTSRAASMLGVSRTFVCTLMDAERLPFTFRGTHRRVRVADVLGYLREQQVVRREALENIQDISRKAGLYDDDF